MQFEHVSEREQELVKKYLPFINNTGTSRDDIDGVLGLLNDFNKPSPNNLMTVNVVRFMLAMSISSQLGLLARLEKEGKLP